MSRSRSRTKEEFGRSKDEFGRGKEEYGRSKEEFGKESGKESRVDRRVGSNSNYYQSDPQVQSYYGRKEEDEDKRSNYSRRSSKKGFKPAKK